MYCSLDVNSGKMLQHTTTHHARNALLSRCEYSEIIAAHCNTLQHSTRQDARNELLFRCEYFDQSQGSAHIARAFFFGDFFSFFMSVAYAIFHSASAFFLFGLFLMSQKECTYCMCFFW